MNILRWHVHGSWTTAFVQGGHHVTPPVLPGRGPDGRGRSWDRPGTAEELPPGRPRERDHDLVVLQCPREAALVRAWIGREPGAASPPSPRCAPARPAASRSCTPTPPASA